MNICIFGDSVTWGARLPARVAWSNLLRNYLEHNAEDYYALYDLGIDGDTSTGLLKRFVVEATARQPELIILAIGINDSVFRQSEDNSATSLDNFSANLKQLIEQSRQFTNDLIIVGIAKGADRLTMPLPRSTTGKSYSKAQTAKYNQVIRQVALSAGVYFVNVETELNDDDFDDGLHPNANGHQKIFQCLLQVLKPMLQIKPVAKTIVVNRANEIIAYKQRTAVQSGDIVRIAGLWLENELGEVLIVQRAVTKLRDPGMWGPACAQTLNEEYSQASLALEYALMHKLQLVIPLANARQETLFVDGTANKDRSFFVQMFFTQVKKTTITPVINPVEIAAYRWLTKEELSVELQQNKQGFVQDFARYLALS
jgi:lysophospholipase L1-like esterase/isopentenyldiphosphate isomerase